MSELESKTEDIMYKSCCGVVDGRLVLFISQLGFSALTASFCIYQLTNSQTSETVSIYLPLLASISGLWLPSPKLGKK